MWASEFLEKLPFVLNPLHVGEGERKGRTQL